MHSAISPVVSFVLFVVASSFPISNASFAASFAEQTLRVPGIVQRVLAEDIDGDGRRELLVFSAEGDREPERRISVFSLDEDRSATPLRSSWLLDPEAGIFAIGHARNEGVSLWYATSGGVKRYRLPEAWSSPPAPEPWSNEPTLFGGRSDEAVIFHDFVDDWHGEGCERPALVRAGHALLPWCDPQMAADEIELQTQIEQAVPHMSFEMSPRMPLLITHRVPSLRRVDVTGDGRPDLVALLGNRIEVHAGNEAGSFSRLATGVTRLPSSAKPHDETRRQVIQLADVTGDDKLDAVLATITGSITTVEQTTAIFPAVDSGWASAPSATFATRGSASATVLTDIDGDGHDEVTTISVAIGVRALLKFLVSRSADVEYETYRVDAAGHRQENPILEWTRPLVIDLGKPSDPGISSLSRDFDGDGLRDLVSAPDDGSVEIRRIMRTATGFTFADAIATFTASGRGQALTTDLNDDGRSDLVLYTPHGDPGRIRVFVSRRD